MMNCDPPSRIRPPRLSRLVRELLDERAANQDARNRGLTRAMLDDALRENASDIHLDPISGGYCWPPCQSRSL